MPSESSGSIAVREEAGSRPRDVVVVVLVTVSASLITLLVNGRFYYYDDTQTSGVGAWYALGTRILAGDFSYLDLTTWTSGNLLVEGQWGLLNPAALLVALGSTAVWDLAVYATAVKVVFLCVGALGIHRLVLALDGGRRIAVLVGSLSPLTGFTVYMDSASWYTGLFVWAWFAWAWVGLVQLRAGRWGYLPVTGFLFLVISMGYVHGALVAAGLIASYLVVDVVRRDWSMAGRMVLLAGLAVAMILPVFLPALLTSGVTDRGSSAITSSGLWGVDLSDLATLTAIAPGVELPAFIAGPMVVPLMYVGWAVPVLLVGMTDRLRSPRFQWGPVVFLIGVLTFMLGPTEIGPLRFPVRVLPYVVMAFLVAAAQISRDGQWRVIRRRSLGRNAAWFLILPMTGAWLTFADIPSLWKQQLAGLAVVLLCLAMLTLVVRRGLSGGELGVVVAATLVCTLASRLWAPSAPLSDFGLPSRTTDMQRQLPGLQGQTFVVGNLEGAPGGLYEEALLARSWEVNPAPVQNSYTIIAYSAYARTLELSYLGLTPASTLDTLLQPDESGRRLADLMSVDHIQLWRHSFADGVPEAPEGWEVTQDGRYTVLWSRDEPNASIGRVTAVTDGVGVEVLEGSPDRVRVEVTNTAEQAGELVFSRLDWPGYKVEGAGHGDPYRGFLLTVDVPPGADGMPVVVEFAPPGFKTGLAALAAGLVVLAAAEVRRRRIPVGRRGDGSP